MIVLRSPADVAAIKHSGIHRLIRERLSEMKLDEPFDQFGELILVESGDNPGAIESSSGCWITTGLFGDENFGSPDFMPSFEWLEHHPEAECWEMLFVMSDDGFGTVLFVPDSPDIDPDLLAFYRRYATTANE